MIIKVNKSLPTAYENAIETVVKEIPYYYSPNTSYDESDEFLPHFNKLIQNPNVVENGQFTHSVVDEGQITSQLYGQIYPILYIFAEKAQVKVNLITRIKINLLLRDKTFLPTQYNFPHADRGSGEKVFIYYVNDSDGNTFLFNEYDDYRSLPPDNFTIVDKIKPVKGTGAFFECSRFHASSNPVLNQHRYVINFNFK